MKDKVFDNRERVAEALNLPAVVQFSVIGSPELAYQLALTRAIEDLVGGDAIRSQSERRSGSGRYMAYRLKVFFETIDQVEDFYRVIGALEGTKTVL